MILFKYSYITLYTITLIVCLIYRRKYTHNLALRLWMYFIVYSLLTEIIGHYFSHIKGVRINLTGNLWGVVSVIFYLSFFLSELKLRITRISVKLLLILFSVFTFIYFIFFNSLIHDLPSRGLIVGSLFVVITIFIYLAELLRGDTILSIQKSLFFWISLGVLIFYLGLLPVLVIAEMIAWQGIFKHIILSLNYIMNICFVMGLIISKKEFNN